MSEFGTISPAVNIAPTVCPAYGLAGCIIAALAYGRYALTFDVSTLPNGVYVVVMIADGVRATQRVVVAR